MPFFVLNKKKNANNQYLIHDIQCPDVKYKNTLVDLGYHDHCTSAFEQAKEMYPSVNSCRHCCRTCHIS